MRLFAIVFSIVLLNFGNFFQSTFLKFITLIVIFLYVSFSFLKKKPYFFKFPISLVPFLILIICGVIRNNNPLTSVIYDFNKVFTFLFWSFAFILTLNRFLFERNIGFAGLTFWLLYFPLLILVGANLLGYLAGLTPYDDIRGEIGTAVFLSKLGININRVDFPFSPGYNGYSSVVGILLLVSLVGYKYFKKYKSLLILGLILSIGSLLLSDTRAALVYPILLFGLYKIVLTRLSSLRLVWMIPLITFIGSIVLLSLLSLLSKMPELSFMVRSSEDLATGNSRTIIWDFSTLEFIKFKLIHLIGYGEFGHFGSGASLNWASIFGSWNKGSELTTPHSTLYAILFDYGYIGLTLIVILQIKVLSIIKKNWSKNKEFNSIALTFLLYWNMIGVTETFVGWYIPNQLYYFMAFTILIFFQEHFYKFKNNLDARVKRKTSNGIV